MLSSFVAVPITAGQTDLCFRPCTSDDLVSLAPILTHAFTHFNLSVGIPPRVDFNSLESATETLQGLLQAESSYFGVVAMHGSSDKPVGAGFIHYTGQGIHSIGPVFVDPSFSNNGAGKGIMQVLLDQAKKTNATSIRLMQVCANTKSFSLYANLGFQPVECISYFEGRTESDQAPVICSNIDVLVRQMRKSDVESCADLFKRAMGYERNLEIQGELLSNPGHAWVAERNGSLLAYTMGFKLTGHSVGTSEEALVTLFSYVSRQWMGKELPTIHIPSRLFPRLVQWALASKLILIRHCWVMVYGEYQYPQHGYIYCPSISH